MACRLKIRDYNDLCPFSLFGLTPSYCLDVGMLENMCLELQKKLHPDLYPNGSNEQELAQNMIQKINESLHILKDPIKRAEVLLNKCDPNTTSAASLCVSSPELIMEMMDLKESIEQCSSTSDLHNMKTKLYQQIVQQSETFQQLFQEQQCDQLKTCYVRLSFLIKTLKDTERVLNNQSCMENIFNNHSVGEKCQQCSYCCKMDHDAE